MNISWKSWIALTMVLAIGFGTGLVMKGWLGPAYQSHLPTTLISTGSGLLAGSAAALVGMLAGCFPATRSD